MHNQIIGIINIDNLQGNFEGYGAARKLELVASGKVFNVDQEDIYIVDHPQLQDGMAEQWPLAIVSGVVFDCIDKIGPDLVGISFSHYYFHIFAFVQVVSFDGGGVSGHPNHIATGKGVIQAVIDYSKTADMDLHCVTLDTTNCIRKFCGPFDTVLSFYLADIVIVNRNPWRTFHAMKAHSSQFVWFRYLFIIFSRYTYVNTFSLVK